MKAKALLVSVLSMVMGQAGTLMASSEELKTMEMDGMRVTWLQDMAASHSRSIFPDASDALMDSLGLRDGVSSSMSAFLVEKTASKFCLIPEWEAKKPVACFARFDGRGACRCRLRMRDSFSWRPYRRHAERRRGCVPECRCLCIPFGIRRVDVDAFGAKSASCQDDGCLWQSCPFV